MPEPEDPIDRLLDELDCRGWTRTKLAGIIGRTPQTISDILHAKIGITPVTALQLGAALTTPAEEWLHMQSAYKLWQLEQASTTEPMLDRIRERVNWA